MRIDSRDLLAVGIFGSKSSLVERIEILLRRGRTFSPRASATGLIASTLALCGLMLAGSLAPRWIAFAQQPVAFEVASIKPSPPISARGVFFGMIDDPDRFHGSYVTLLDLMTTAYDVEHARISGWPSWVLSDRFDVIATLPRGTTRGQIPLLLQTLLSERFKLSVRRESRMTRVYALVPAKRGPKLKRSEPEDSPSPGRNPTPISSAPLIMRANGATGICCGKAKLNRVTMGRFAVLLSAETDRPVQDQTGIQGVFDVSLEWTPDLAAPQPGRDTVEAPATSPTGPSIYTAVQEQLGLRLEPRSAPLEYLVIEHVEKPDAN
jgi:uncharacterized protein (TIGR03435 family)